MLQKHKSIIMQNHYAESVKLSVESSLTIMYVIPVKDNVYSISTLHRTQFPYLCDYMTPIRPKYSYIAHINATSQVPISRAPILFARSSHTSLSSLVFCG